MRLRRLQPSGLVLASALIGLAAGPHQAAQSTPPIKRKPFIRPIQGLASVGYNLTYKVEGGFIVTTMVVKNLSPAPIAGMKVDEFWWDKAGNPIAGDTKRLTKPLDPGEVATLVLRTPRHPKMDRNNYMFSHANGKVEPKKMKELKATSATTQL
ncbi:MAG: hypothetical protein ACRD1T_09855 [Acidimicrobiia bacterium]